MFVFFSKQKHLPFPSSSTHSSNIFDLMHMDIWGPASAPSMHGYKYFLTVRFTWIHLMKSKAETSSLVRNFFYLVENQFQTSIKSVKTMDLNSF